VTPPFDPLKHSIRALALAIGWMPCLLPLSYGFSAMAHTLSLFFYPLSSRKRSHPPVDEASPFVFLNPPPCRLLLNLPPPICFPPIMCGFLGCNSGFLASEVPYPLVKKVCPISPRLHVSFFLTFLPHFSLSGEPFPIIPMILLVESNPALGSSVAPVLPSL